VARSSRVALSVAIESDIGERSARYHPSPDAGRATNRSD